MKFWGRASLIIQVVFEDVILSEGEPAGLHARVEREEMEKEKRKKTASPNQRERGGEDREIS